MDSNITIYGESFVPFDVPHGMVWAMVILSLVFPVVLYFLRSIGLYTLAKRKQLKCAWLSFIPCVWIYVACRLVAETRFLNTTIGKWAIVLTIIFALSELLTLTYNFLIYYPLVGNYFVGNDIIICMDAEYAKGNGFTEFWLADQGIWVNESFVYPYNDVFKMIKILNAVFFVSMIFDFLYIIIKGIVLINLFKKYWPQHFVLAFVLSVFFGLTGLFVFLIRNKQPVNYNDYLRARYQAYGPYGYYGGPRPPYGNPYNNPYGNQGYQGNTAQPKAPFEDYADPSERTPDEPFGDYNKNNDNDKRDGE